MKLLYLELIIDHVKWLFGGAKAGQKAGFHVMLKYFEKKGFSLLYKANRFHIAVRLIQK